MKELLTLINQNENIINSEEFYDNLYKFSAFLIIIRNKKINPTILLCSLLDNKKYHDILLQKSEVENFNLIMRYILDQYPNLQRSKLIRQKFKKYILKNERLRKKNL